MRFKLSTLPGPQNFYLCVLSFLILFFTYSLQLSAQISIDKYSCEDCKVYLLTEYTVSQPIGISGDPLDRHVDISANLGMMYKVSDKFGVGGHIFGGGYLNGGWHSQIGISPRISHYFHKIAHVDLSPGFILADSGFPDGFAGYSFGAGIMWKNHVGLTARLDILEPSDFRERQTILNVGLRTDGKKGALLSVISTAVAVVSYVLSRN